MQLFAPKKAGSQSHRLISSFLLVDLCMDNLSSNKKTHNKQRPTPLLNVVSIGTLNTTLCTKIMAGHRVFVSSSPSCSSAFMSMTSPPTKTHAANKD